MLVTRTCPWVVWIELMKPLGVKAWTIIRRTKILSMARKMLKSNNLFSVMLGFWLYTKFSESLVVNNLINHIRN